MLLLYSDSIGPAGAATVLIAAVSGLASLLTTGLVRVSALRHNVLDLPNARSSHTTPTPRGGGLAIIVGIMLGLAIAGGRHLADSREILTVAVGVVALGFAGWVDDTRGLRADRRLVVHVLVALWTLYMLGGLPNVRIGSGSLTLGAAGYLLGLVGIVWSINLFNFMDGIDGLAGSQAVLIFGVAAVWLVASGNHHLGSIAVIVASAAAGFLVWNWPPAKIFMGDVGSGTLGYLVAALAISSENRGSVPLLTFAILGGVFVIDSTMTLVRRVAHGERATDAHRNHAYQRLSRAWGSHRPVTMAAAGLTCLLAALGAIGMTRPRFLLGLLVVAYSGLVSLFVLAERKAPL
jgi:Fuc2NAc and GlcNAc transferase